MATGFELDVPIAEPGVPLPAPPGIPELKAALGSFATGVTVVTLLLGDRPHGLTANSFTSVSLAPPLIAVCLARRSRVLSRIRPGTGFAVNVLASDQDELCRRFAGPAEDRFAGVAWSPGVVGAPLLTGSLAVLECCLERWFYGGDHVILLGAVRSASSSARAPLLVYRGAFATFETPAGEDPATRVAR